MMMANDLTRVRPRHRLMPEQDRMGDEFLDELTANPVRRMRVVIAEHPDETMRRRSSRSAGPVRLWAAVRHPPDRETNRRE